LLGSAKMKVPGHNSTPVGLSMYRNSSGRQIFVPIPQRRMRSLRYPSAVLRKGSSLASFKA
jgi:hypothetical protein